MPYEAQLRKSICDNGRRIHAQGFVAGNDGNLSIRLDNGNVLCTPTMISKGFMQPYDLCIVNLDGRRLSGDRKCTSEILLHLEVYKHDPSAKAVVHTHPPHATAFAVAHEDIPTGILPEVEVFLGAVPRADYETPGSADFAQTVRPFIGKANTVLLSNHGTVSWGDSIERAFWLTEILDGYCRMLILARQLGNVERLPENKVRELLALRPKFGVPPDPRAENGNLYVNRDFGRP